MQMVPGTFAAYALPGHTNIYNPVDNIAAAIRYIIARYGGYGGMPGLSSGYALGGIFQGMGRVPAMLADNGAMLPPKSLTAVANNTRRSEYVLTEDQLRQIGGYAFENHFHGPDFSARDVAREIVQEIRQA